MKQWGRIPAMLLAVALMGAAQPAAAVTLADARSLYTLGNFRAAALAAASLETAESLALASRARLVRAAYLLPPDRAVEELHRAEALARRSLELEPRQAEASLNLAIILGYRTRVEGYVDSFFAGRAKEAKTLIATAEEVEPQSGWAKLISGAWNAEIVVGAGSALAETMFGATRDKAVAAFEEAVRLDATNPTIRLEYAKALIKLYGERGWPTAKGHLEAALALEPSDTIDELMQDRAQALLAALEEAEPDMVLAQLQEIDPFSQH